MTALNISTVKRDSKVQTTFAQFCSGPIPVYLYFRWPVPLMCEKEANLNIIFDSEQGHEEYHLALQQSCTRKSNSSLGKYQDSHLQHLREPF